MRNPTYKLLLWAILVSFLWAACGNNPEKTETHTPPPGPTPEQMIAKSWRLQKFNQKGTQVPPAVMMNSSFSFSSDGRFEILLGELEKGTWKLSDDKKILITYSDKGGESHIDIEYLSKDRLVLINPEGPNPIRMELVPV